MDYYILRIGIMHTEIKFQENKINDTSNEEDIKMRENKIKQLQKDLFETRKNIEHRLIQPATPKTNGMVERA